MTKIIKRECERTDIVWHEAEFDRSMARRARNADRLAVTAGISAGIVFVVVTFAAILSLVP